MCCVNCKRIDNGPQCQIWNFNHYCQRYLKKTLKIVVGHFFVAIYNILEFEKNADFKLAYIEWIIPFNDYYMLVHSSLHLARVSVVACAKWMLSFNVSECKKSGPYELLSTVHIDRLYWKLHPLEKVIQEWT